MRCRHSIEIERQRIEQHKRLSDYSFQRKIYHYEGNTTSPSPKDTYRSYYGFMLAHFLFALNKSPRENLCLHSFRVNRRLLWWDFHPLDGQSLCGRGVLAVNRLSAAYSIILIFSAYLIFPITLLFERRG